MTRKSRAVHDLAALRKKGFALMTRGERTAAAKAGIITPVRSQRERQLRHRYGLTLESYRILYDLQGWACACCGTQDFSQNLYVDHDHETNQVRALVCAACNTTIGFLETTPQRLKQAEEYLAYYG